MDNDDRDFYARRALSAFESLQLAICEAGGAPIEFASLEKRNAAEWFLQLARNNIQFIYVKPND